MPRFVYASQRTTAPDPAALLAAIRAIEATAGITSLDAVFTVKTTAALDASTTAKIEAAIDAAPALTPERSAQNTIDNWPIEAKALVLTLIDQLNVIRAALPAPMNAITPGQALAAVRAKAATL